MSKKKSKAKSGTGSASPNAAKSSRSGAGPRDEAVAAEQPAPKANAMADEVQEPIRALSDAPSPGGQRGQDILARLERMESALSALAGRFETGSAARDAEFMARLDKLDRIEASLASLAERSEPRPSPGEGELQTRLERIDSALSALAGRFETASAARDAEFLTRLDKLDRMEAALAPLADTSNMAMPLLKDTLPRVIAWFDDLERKGVLGLANGLVAALERVAERHGPEELEKLGDALSLLIRTSDRICCPEAQGFIERAASAPSRVDMARAESMGLRDVLRSARDARLRRGLAIMLELMRAMAPEERNETDRYGSA